MVIKKIEINKFRGFQNVGFDLGSQLTVIAGQNGTQKTTLLGLLSQSFTITDSPMKDDKPLCGGTFKSAFNEKFKFSGNFDKPKSHEWTLHLNNDNEPYIIESIARDKTGRIRFWQKGNRSKGSGYIQLPVIYLSLKRLLPIGEDVSLNESTSFILTPNEFDFYKKWHNKILIIFDEISEANYLASPNKNTLGANTDYYDWKQNSAGQDNLGKLLLAILSFKRLKEKYPVDYKGGILAIDELDATLYPASQIKLTDALRKFASDFQIQIIFTTHSLPILEYACESQKTNSIRPATKDQIKVVYLEKKDLKISILSNVSFDLIKHRINAIDKNKKAILKIDVFTEDSEAIIFAKALLKSKSSKLKFVDCTLGCDNLIDLLIRKVPSFVFPNSMIILDGDVQSDPKKNAKIKKYKNIVILPTKMSPERLLAEYLFGLSDESEVWESINAHYTKQVCFRDYSIEEIKKERVKAKEWFNSHYKSKRWGKNAAKVINPWSKEHPAEVKEFIESFRVVYNNFAKELSIDQI